jgi:hypothetical protein
MGSVLTRLRRPLAPGGEEGWRPLLKVGRPLPPLGRAITDCTPRSWSPRRFGDENGHHLPDTRALGSPSRSPNFGSRDNGLSPPPTAGVWPAATAKRGAPRLTEKSSRLPGSRRFPVGLTLPGRLRGSVLRLDASRFTCAGQAGQVKFPIEAGRSHDGLAGVSSPAFCEGNPSPTCGVWSRSTSSLSPEGALLPSRSGTGATLRLH